MVMCIRAPDCNWFIRVGRAILAGIKECFVVVTLACHRSHVKILTMLPLPDDSV